MSNGFTSLWKVSLKQTFDFRGKKNLSFFIPILLILIFGSLFSSIYAFSLCMLAREALIPMTYTIYMMGGIASLIALTTAVTKVKVTLFGGNDYEMLASLPIKRGEIIFVKFFSLYLMELLYSFIFVIPVTIMAVIFGNSPLVLVDGILVFLITPVLPLLLAGVIGILFGLITDRFRFGNILTILLLFGFLGLVAYVSYFLNNRNLDSQEFIRLFEIFLWINPTQSLLNLDLPGFNYLLYVGVNVIVLCGVILLFAKLYDYFHLLLNSFKQHKAYKEKKWKPSSRFKSLFMLDIKRYFSSKAYMMNTITGGILCVLMTIVLLISFTSVQEPGVDEVLKNISPFFCLFILWCAGFAVPSAASINYEGKSFWQIKALPIDYKKYGLSKILLSYTILAPFLLIASIILLFFGRIEFITVFTTLVLPQIYLMAMCFIGFMINSVVYRLNWTSEMQAVKNAGSVAITMLIDVGFTAVLSLVFILVGLWNFIVGAVLALCLAGVVLMVMILLFLRLTERNMTNIEI